MKNLFNPKSVAIIGASAEKGKIGNILLENLKKLKYEGKVYPINPKHKKIEGFDCHSTVLDVEDEIDLAIVAIPAGFVPKAVQECAWKSQPIKNIIIISAGFSESGEEGKKLEEEIKNLAKEYELNIVGPNCLGVVNATDNLNLSFSKNNFPKGKVGLIMQSGAFTTALFDLAQGENFGFSLVATLGNKAVLNETDFLKYFSQDDKTQIIGMYLEDIKNGKEFRQAIRNVSVKKPVLILKAGNSKKSQAAILSHTGAMAGESDVIKEALIESGALYFDNLIEFASAIKMINGFKKPQNDQVVIITNAGGPGVITTDLVEKNKKLNLFEFTEQQQQMLKEVLPSASSVHNPVDVLGDADHERYQNILDKLSKIKNIGSVLAIVTPQAQTDVKEICEVLASANSKYDFPVVPIVIGTEAGEIAESVFEKSELSNFVYPSTAVNALEKYFVLSQNQENLNNNNFASNPPSDQKKNLQILDKLNEAGRKVFFYAEARDLVLGYGIDAIESFEVEAEKEIDGLNISFPVVLKIDSSKILHKNSKGGLVLNIQNKEQLKQAFGDLRAQFSDEKFLVQTQIKPGMEIILGLKKDDNFGHVLMIGLGGIMTEIFNEKLLWILPTDDQSVEMKIKDSILKKVFEKQKIDIDLLITEAKKIIELALENEWIGELDINPMIFYPNERPIAVDVKVIKN